jgi:hypothetical protein
MVIDIQRTVIKTQLRRFLTLIILAVFIIVVLLTGDRSKVILGMNKYSWALIIGLIYVVILVAESYLELNYVYFSDEGSNLILRYFSMSVMNRKKNSIEIPKDAFAGYEYQRSLWGFKKNIRLFQRFKRENARYPSVSLSGMSDKEVKLLLKTLDKYNRNK